MKGIILSSKFIQSDLAFEYGKVLPVELPLNDFPLIKHQIDFLEKYCSEIILIKPVNYTSKIIERYRGNLNIISNEFNSIIEAFTFISSLDFDKCFILYGDTLFDGDLDIADKNYFFVNSTSQYYDWGETYHNQVPSGGMIFQKEKLLKLLEDSIDFNYFAKKCFIDNSIIKFNSLVWYDFGSINTYYESKKYFLKTRTFNKIIIHNNFLQKQSNDFFKIWAEFNWFKKLNNLDLINLPQVKLFNLTSNNASYYIEYLNLPVLSDIFVFGKYPHEYFFKILLRVKEDLLKIQSVPVTDRGVNFMYIKLLDRQSSVNDIFERYPNKKEQLKKIYHQNISFFKENNFKNVLMHGDFCFSNILFDFKSFTPYLIDPRGFLDRNYGAEIIGPEIYDVVKLAHSYLCSYDLIIHDDYTKIDFIGSEKFNNQLEEFIELFNIEKQALLNGLINLFLTMLPLHRDNFKRQEAFIEVSLKLASL